MCLNLSVKVGQALRDYTNYRSFGVKNCDITFVVVNKCTTQSVDFLILEKYDLAYDKEEFED